VSTRFDAGHRPQEFVDRPLVAGVLAVLGDEDTTVGPDQEVGGQTKSAAARISRRQPLTPARGPASIPNSAYNRLAGSAMTAKGSSSTGEWKPGNTPPHYPVISSVPPQVPVAEHFSVTHAILEKNLPRLPLPPYASRNKPL
jgi:hypothetical protein